jgi:hypothetical protein
MLIEQEGLTDEVACTLVPTSSRNAPWSERCSLRAMKRFAFAQRAKLLIAIGDKQNTVFFLDASGLATTPSIAQGTD